MRIERQGEVAVVVLEWGKANAMNLAFLDALDGLLDQLGDASALVITAPGAIFSAGLDLPSLVELSPAAFRVFIDRFSEVMLRIFELPLPVLAAINGHAIAGGCALALQADERIMAAGPGKIGLNEAQLGMGLPPVILEALRAQVPARSLVPIALEGRLHSAEEALRLGLVDAIVPDARAAAIDRAGQLASAGAAQIKAAIRAPVSAAIRAAGNQGWTETWFAPAAQERIRAAVARLTKKQAPAGP
jgi:enoyl-CoA hydratase